MTFADGLPVKLTRIVEPVPKPPIPIMKNMPKQKSVDLPTSPLSQTTPEKTVEVSETGTLKSKFNIFKKKKNSLPSMSLKDGKQPESTEVTESFNKSLSFSTDFINNNVNPVQVIGDVYDIPKRRTSGPSASTPLSVPQDPSTYFTESDKNIEYNLEINDNLIEHIYFCDPPKKFEPNEWNHQDPELYDTQKNLMKEGNQSTGTNYYVSKEDLKLEMEIGSGEFGNVLKGIYKLPSGRKIWVAVKTLHKEHYEENYPEFLREASVMIKLDNPYIVKLIGITKGPPIGLVQELLLLGSLSNYLMEHTDEIDNKDIDKWASQIAIGMEYLESKRFVHRDLASRNILLAAKDHCKISDFGLSRALGSDKDFYQSKTGGRW